MPFHTTYYTQTHDELYTHSQRNLSEDKTTFLLYNGAIESDEDPADYYAPVKAVRIA
ncbi:hypothetical protein I2483_13820 [Sporosarcina sp. E16_3]|uniref:hypothetical protein n=1 Tax=Sporosarcina sp. E16_3 TaxID=2789293 RepID=UPI001A913E78|nr:hypothetical protein [Sporosarcina sp. E16_3]MBO0602741.1 hypothetical protein [Sporosarcina sp. E16_3]